MKTNTVQLNPDEIEKALLLDDGIFKKMIFLFKDGKASYCTMTTELLAKTFDANIKVVNVEDLAWQKN